MFPANRRAQSSGNDFENPKFTPHAKMNFAAMSPADAQRARQLLCALGDHIRDAVVDARASGVSGLADVSRESVADTIYAIDQLSEDAITLWFEKQWPNEWPVELVAEGLDDPDARVFPRGTPVSETRWKCIIDPIDGTRGLMYDKRSAWALAALAPQKHAETKLSDLFVAMMTELPISKQWRADQISAVRGCGIIAEAVNVLEKSRAPLKLQPSQARDFKHGFCSFAKFFPEGKAATAHVEEQLWSRLYSGAKSPVIFDDQYISSGGQFYELLAGHDRMTVDLRPLVHKAGGIQSTLLCHPYDVCAALILREAGVIYETWDGQPVDAPLDLTSPVSWVAYANENLANLARPILRELIAEMVPKK
jgi:hypothetical protein